MGVELAREQLHGGDVTARAITYVPPLALEAIYWGQASGPAEALAALATDLSLDMAFVPAEAEWADDAAGRLHDAGVAVAWSVTGVFGRVAQVEGWREALVRSAGDPSALAHPLASALHDALVDARTGLTRRADAVVIADDLAGARGWLISPDFALDALVPCYRSLAGEANAAGVSAIFHSDGDVRTLFPALGKAGFAAVHAGGLRGAQLQAYATAADAAGLVTIGALPGSDLMAGAAALADEATELAAQHRLMIADDGGIASVEELTAFVSAMRRIERNA